MSLNLSFFICKNGDNNTDFIRVVVRIKLYRIPSESLAQRELSIECSFMVMKRIIILPNITLCQSGLGVRMLEF